MIPLRASVRAFSLVEVTLALGVAAFALLAIFGLLPVGISNNQASIQQTAATNIATAIIADLKQTPNVTQIASSGTVALTPTSPRYGINVTSPSTTIYLDDSGSPQASAGVARYKATIALTQPASGRTATTGILKIGWPAAAPVSQGSITVFVALDRN